MAEVAAVVVAGAATVSAVSAAVTAYRQIIASSNNVDTVYGALDGAIKMLVAQRDDLHLKVQRHSTTVTPSNTYMCWNDQVNKVKEKVEAIRILYEKRKKKRWLYLFHPSITKEMKEIASDVFLLMEKNIADLTCKKPPERVVNITTQVISDIPTLQKPLEQILVWLNDEKVKGIRIQGTVGIGKTTIMQNLNNHVKVGEIFDRVIWVRVSREGSTENKSIDQVQQVIVKRLNLRHEDWLSNEGMATDLDLVASTIKEELKDIKYLLLLDDVTENLDLEKIGVPMNGNGSKIVFTTRSQHVCFKIADRHVIINKLKSEEEALVMFKSVLNQPELEKKDFIKVLMSRIVKWCGYHPLMINVAAGVFSMKVMKNDAATEQSWNDGLTNLNNWQEEDGDMQNFYNSLKCFFDCLEVTKKKCFFYSALYPEDSDIQKACLLDNWAAEKLLGTNDDVETKHAKGRGVLEYLTMASLIEETTSQQCIKIHKLIREAALYNLSTNEDHGSLVKSGKTLQNPPDAECWKEKKWISLVDSKMKALPDKPDCSMLSTLFLQKNLNLEAIPQAFFTHMQNLYVLDLYDTGIKSLPSSLLKQIPLKVLYLQNCVALVELPSDIEKLKELEVLDIRGSGIANIPPQVETLIHLRRLLVSFTISPSQTPIQEATNVSQMISTLLCLKELVIEIEESLQEILYAAIVNVVKLTSLSLLQFCSSNKVGDHIKTVGDNLKIHFPSEKLLQSFINKVNGDECKNCQIFTGCDTSLQPRIGKPMPYYMFNGGVSNNIISQVLCNDVVIELVNHNELEHLSTFTPGHMNRIRGCVIEGCKRMRTMVDAKVGGSILTNVEQLHMINLPLLKSIYEGPMQGLKSLKTLILCDCPMLTVVCAYGVILKLPEICHIEVRGCSMIEEIFSGSPNIASPILPNLKTLILVGMPELRSILVSDSFNWPSLEELTILKCPELKRLPFQKDTAVKLISIEAEKKWWDRLENEKEVKEEFARRRKCNLIDS